MTPEQERQRINYSIAALSNGITIGKRRFSKIEKRLADEVARLTEALDAERARADALEVEQNEIIRARRDAERIAQRDAERIEQSVGGLDQALGETIRKSRTLRPRQRQYVRDKTGRITEIIVTEDGSDTAIIITPVRDASGRVVASEDRVVPIEDQT
jgi:hypothetical protein